MLTVLFVIFFCCSCCWCKEEEEEAEEKFKEKNYKIAANPFAVVVVIAFFFLLSLWLETKSVRVRVCERKRQKKQSSIKCNEERNQSKIQKVSEIFQYPVEISKMYSGRICNVTDWIQSEWNKVNAKWMWSNAKCIWMSKLKSKCNFQKHSSCFQFLNFYFFFSLWPWVVQKVFAYTKLLMTFWSDM